MVCYVLWGANTSINTTKENFSTLYKLQVIYTEYLLKNDIQYRKKNKYLLIISIKAMFIVLGSLFLTY